MSEGETYSWQALVTDQNNKSVYVIITWTTNKSPRCNQKLQVLERSGRKFKIRIPDCYDPDFHTPLSYSFGTVRNGFQIPCLYPTYSSSIWIWLLPGNRQFAAVVCDTLGSCYIDVQTIIAMRQIEINDRTTIQDDYTEAKNLNEDLTPCAISDLSNAYDLTENDWVCLLYTSPSPRDS